MDKEQFKEVYRHSLAHIMAKAVIEIFGEESVQRREQRNKGDHADKAEHSAADRDRKERPEHRHSEGISENLRAEDIAVKLLEQQNEDDKRDYLPRLGDQHEQTARHGAEDRAEERDDIRDTDNN